MPIPSELHRIMSYIRLLILDVDGVLTDGTLYYGADGEHIKAFNVRDGQGLVSLQQTGVQVAIITKRESPIITKRMQDLGISLVFQGQKDKVPAFQQLLHDLKITPEQVAMVGDDLPDLPLILMSGMGITVADGAATVKEYADWVTPSKGGRGAVRDVCEAIMQSQGKWLPLVESFTSS